jgi:hypothetical protein
MRVTHAYFGQDSLQQLALGFRQPLAEDPRGDANNEFAVFRSFLTRRAKPRVEAMRIDPPFHVLQNFFPGIHALRTSKMRKIPITAISTTVEKLWKIQPQELLAAAVSFWVDPATLSPSVR